MHCPTCGQQQISDDTRFCSRCGFLLTGVAEVVANGGVIPGSLENRTASTPRKRGLKQGLFVFLMAFLIVPLIVMLSIAVGARPYVAIFSAILLTVGGLLRMAYALMFESSEPGGMTLEEKLVARTQMPRASDAPALPAQPSMPASDYFSPTSARGAIQAIFRPNPEASPTALPNFFKKNRILNSRSLLHHPANLSLQALLRLYRSLFPSPERYCWAWPKKCGRNPSSR